jgi:hypothetical protein
VAVTTDVRTIVECGGVVAEITVTVVLARNTETSVIGTTTVCVEYTVKT